MFKGTALDFGARSNDSEFGEYDDEKPLGGWRPLPQRPVAVPGEPLAFHVGIVGSEEELQRVQALRQAAYGHHLPALAANFGLPDPVDRWPDVTLFYAEDKATGRLVGSARLQSNRSQPLQIERSITLPPHLLCEPLAEITRLVVMPGYAHPVKLALVKAIRMYCVAMQIGGIVAASRPSLMRQYVGLGFEDLYGDNRLAPMAHGGGLDHRILFLDTVVSEAHMRVRNKAIHAFVFRTYHPDIDVFGAISRVSERLRHGLADVDQSRAA